MPTTPNTHNPADIAEALADFTLGAAAHHLWRTITASIGSGIRLDCHPDGRIVAIDRDGTQAYADGLLPADEDLDEILGHYEPILFMLIDHAAAIGGPVRDLEAILDTVKADRSDLLASDTLLVAAARQLLDELRGSDSIADVMFCVHGSDIDVDAATGLDVPVGDAGTLLQRARDTVECNPYGPALACLLNDRGRDGDWFSLVNLASGRWDSPDEIAASSPHPIRRATTIRFEVPSPAVGKAVIDIIDTTYGQWNPRPLDPAGDTFIAPVLPADIGEVDEVINAAAPYARVRFAHPHSDAVTATIAAVEEGAGAEVRNVLIADGADLNEGAYEVTIVIDDDLSEPEQVHGTKWHIDGFDHIDPDEWRNAVHFDTWVQMLLCSPRTRAAPDPSGRPPTASAAAADR